MTSVWFSFCHTSPDTVNCFPCFFSKVIGGNTFLGYFFFLSKLQPWIKRFVLIYFSCGLFSLNLGLWCHRWNGAFKIYRCVFLILRVLFFIYRSCDYCCKDSLFTGTAVYWTRNYISCCSLNMSHRSVTEILYSSYMCILHYIPVFPSCVMNFFFIKLVVLRFMFNQ